MIILFSDTRTDRYYILVELIFWIFFREFKNFTQNNDHTISLVTVVFFFMYA